METPSYFLILCGVLCLFASGVQHDVNETKKSTAYFLLALIFFCLAGFIG